MAVGLVIQVVTGDLDVTIEIRPRIGVGVAIVDRVFVEVDTQPTTPADHADHVDLFGVDVHDQGAVADGNTR